MPSCQEGRHLALPDTRKAFAWPQDTSKGKRTPGEEAFEQKWLILSIIEGGSRSKPGVLGQVVINMADYAADDQQAQQSFVVAVARKDVSNAVGEVRMLATVG